MKQLLIFLGLAILILFATSLKIDKPSCTHHVLKAEGPPVFSAGEPPYNTHCASSGCHVGNAVNSGTAQLQLDLGNALGGYELAKAYTITVSVTKPGLLKTGFQLIALQDNDQSISPGIMTLTDPTRTQLLDSNSLSGNYGKKLIWVEQTLTGSDCQIAGQSSWSFTWTAPSSNVGQITFYLAALEGNNNGDETGDFTYLKTQSINYLSTGIETKISTADISIYPNPCTKFISIKSNLYQGLKEVQLVQMDGKLIHTWNRETIAGGTKKTTLDLSEFSTGNYLLKMHFSNSTVARKISITN